MFVYVVFVLRPRELLLFDIVCLIMVWLVDMLCVVLLEFVS